MAARKKKDDGAPRLAMRFWFQCNKPASVRRGKPQISVHVQGQCHIFDNVRCEVRTEGIARRRQPYFVMVGECGGWRMEGKTMVMERRGGQ